MISIERTKQLLNDSPLSDKEIEEIRDSFRALAEIIFEKWLEERKQEKKCAFNTSNQPYSINNK